MKNNLVTMCVYLCVFVQSGIDVNRLNSYEQTALEVVNKFTASRGAREIKQMLRGNIIISCLYQLQWRRSVVKYGGEGRGGVRVRVSQVKPSINLFQYIRQ